MARGLCEHEIFDLLGDGNISELDFSDEETEDQFDNEELPELKLKDLEEWNYPPEMPSITDYFYEYLNDDIFEKMVYNT